MNKKNNFRPKINERHTFHLVARSPWPIAVSWALFSWALLLVIHFYYWNNGITGNNSIVPHSVYNLYVYLTICLIFNWFDSIEEEASLFHTLRVEAGLRCGMILFIVSEVMFFFSFFFAFFYLSVNPNMDIGFVWPPADVVVIDPKALPLLNTLLLLSSGTWVTLAHNALMSNNQDYYKFGLIESIMLGITFTALQAVEYAFAPFSMADNVYGSLFFMCTGFHGFHVIIGTIFLMVQLDNAYEWNGKASANRHFGFEAASWYWHFVDVVWLFLYGTIYWWGS